MYLSKFTRRPTAFLHAVYLHGLYYKEFTLGESGGVTVEIAEDGIFLWLKLLYIQKLHSILLQRHSIKKFSLSRCGQ